MPTRTATLDMLAQVPLFEGLAKKDLKRLRDELKESSFSAGTVIMAEGTKGGRFFLVVEGKVSLSRAGVPLGLLGPGECFGEWALLDGGVRTATVTADSDVVALTMAPWTFKSLLLGEPELMLRILQQTIRRYREHIAQPG